MGSFGFLDLGLFNQAMLDQQVDTGGSSLYRAPPGSYDVGTDSGYADDGWDI
jgi:hypothetical protein